MIEVGRFTYDTSTGEITGPADYVRERLDEYLAEVKSGRHGWLFAYASEGQTIERTILVGIQTDYAGYRGSRDVLGSLR